MQAIILAAGKGSRLGEHTKDNTKCMLEVNGQKLIDLALTKLKSVNVKKVILVVGYQRDNLIQYLGTEKYGIQIEYVVNKDFDKTNNIYSLYLAREYLVQDDTLLLESDLIFDEEILHGLVNDPRPSLAVVDKYESWMDGTVVTLNDENRITNFVPKKFFNYNLIEQYFKTVNIYKFSQNFSMTTYVPFLEAYSSALGNNEYYEQVLRVVIELENQELEAYPLTSGERWYEIDDIQDKDNAETVFARSKEEKLSLTQKRFGGFWRYPQLTDFCYLVNPYFPNTQFLEECQAYLKDLICEYPSGARVQSLLASKLFKVDVDSILVGNGAAEIIKVLGSVYDGTFGIMQPTFYEYIDAIGENRVKSLIPNDSGFKYTKEEVIELSQQVDNLILINPDNPSGHFLSKKDVCEILEVLSKQNKNFIVDESFIDFAENGFAESLLDKDILSKYKNLMIIKSISKSYGVPGIRLGVVISYDKDLIKRIYKHLSIWNINSFGEFFLQIIGKYEKSYLLSCEKIIAERKRFFTELNQIPFLKVYESQANYFLCEVLDQYTATDLTQTLLHDYDLFIKDLTGKKGFENKQYIRVAVRNKADNDKLLEKLNLLS